MKSGGEKRVVFFKKNQVWAAGTRPGGIGGEVFRGDGQYLVKNFAIL